LVSCCVVHLFLDAVRGQISYSIPEELEHGAFIANIAEDLGLDLDKLSVSRFRIVSGAKKQYVEVNLENGVLFVSERIDREELMRPEFVLFFPLMEILDVNDNCPSFPWTEFNLDISKSAGSLDALMSMKMMQVTRP
uniref:Cadherin N-terminal domain-containing protein n=1 Tax=Monopterus albus TaxID=43700 RepID=A0A3Q3IBZ0_MONAL